MFDDGGQLVSYIGVQSDVSELMRRREEERRLLEAKVCGGVCLCSVLQPAGYLRLIPLTSI